MLLSFIIVAYNAEQKLPALLEDLQAQTCDRQDVELLLVDGRSNDGTRQVMERYRQEHGGEYRRVLVLDNPGKTLPCGWNVALSAALGEVILRVDAHARIPADFIQENLRALEAGEDIVGGPCISIIDQDSGWQRVLLQAENSLFGSGIARFRSGTVNQYVSTLAHAAYRRKVFEQVGGYDQRLARTEDNEIHYRMRSAGYRFYFTTSIHFYHHARSSLKAMVRQKYGNGKWIGLTMGISPKCFSLYHLVPGCFVLALLGGLVLGLFGWWWPLWLLLIAYFAVALAMTAASMVQLGREEQGWTPWSLLLPGIFFLLHTAYGVGTVTGLVRMPFWRRRPENRTCPQIEQTRQAMLQNHAADASGEA